MPNVLTLTIVKRLEIKGASKYNVKNVHLLLDEQHCIYLTCFQNINIFLLYIYLEEVFQKYFNVNFIKIENKC